MIIDCPGRCGKKIIIQCDGRAYLCKPCYKTLIDTILHLIRPATEPHLSVVKPTEVELPEELPAA